jgi:hypothetical protein
MRTGAVPSGIKRPGHEADYSFEHNVESDDAWNYISS